MNEGDESLPSTETRKKRRGLGFRYSSKKDLERSRVKKRTAKVGIYELLLLQRHYHIQGDYLTVVLLDQVVYIVLT
jgi:hypothetical protein